MLAYTRYVLRIDNVGRVNTNKVAVAVYLQLLFKFSELYSYSLFLVILEVYNGIVAVCFKTYDIVQIELDSIVSLRIESEIRTAT